MHGLFHICSAYPKLKCENCMPLRVNNTTYIDGSLYVTQKGYTLGQNYSDGILSTPWYYCKDYLKILIGNLHITPIYWSIITYIQLYQKLISDKTWNWDELFSFWKLKETQLTKLKKLKLYPWHRKMAHYII